MTILVLGGTGFIGRCVVRKLLAERKDFVVLTRNPKKLGDLKFVPFVIGDLFDPERIEISPYHQIINCAGELCDKKVMQSLHVEATLNLLHKFKSVPDGHWLQLSSVGVYGKKQSGLIQETCDFAPIGTYEETKAAGELLIKNFCTAYKIRYTIIRPSNVFGSGMPNQSLAQLVNLIKNRLFFYIGKPDNAISMNYVPVEDVANLILCCLESELAYNEDFIISDRLPLPEFIQIIAKTLNVKASFRSLPESFLRGLAKLMRFFPSFPLTESRVDALTTQAIYSSEKALLRLNHKPIVGIREGLRNYCAEWVGSMELTA